jgi:hypothetical protein
MLRLKNLKVCILYLYDTCKEPVLNLIVYINWLHTYIPSIYRSIWPYYFECMVWDKAYLRSTVQRNHWLHKKVVLYRLYSKFYIFQLSKHFFLFFYHNFSLPGSFTSPTQTGFLTLSGSGQSSQTSQASQYSVPQRYTFNAPPKHMAELLSCNEVFFFQIYSYFQFLLTFSANLTCL